MDKDPKESFLDFINLATRFEHNSKPVVLKPGKGMNENTQKNHVLKMSLSALGMPNLICMMVPKIRRKMDNRRRIEVKKGEVMD